MQNGWIKLTVAIPAVVFIIALPAFFYLSKTEEMLYLANPLIYAGAGVLSITGLLIIYFLYLRRDTYRSINTLSLGLLLTIFIVGWSIPQLNSQLGWGNLCAKAKELAEKLEITDYWVYNISRSENMDVYLGKDIIKIGKDDLFHEPHENRLLMLRSKDIKNDSDLQLMVSDKEQYQIGEHTIVIF